MAKKALSPEARSILQSQVSRRAVLAGAGAVAGASALAACGSSGGSAGAAKDTVRWGNWPLYLDYDEATQLYPTLEAFTESTGIAAEYFEDYNDNDEFFGKVQAQLKIRNVLSMN